MSGRRGTVVYFLWAPMDIMSPSSSFLMDEGVHGCPVLQARKGNLTYNWIGPAGQDSNASIIINSESLRINYEVYCWHYDNNFFVRPKLTTVIGKEIGRTCKKLLSTDPLSTSHKE
jgi:hypothetical protein